MDFFSRLILPLLLLLHHLTSLEQCRGGVAQELNEKDKMEAK